MPEMSILRNFKYCSQLQHLLTIYTLHIVISSLIKSPTKTFALVEINGCHLMLALVACFLGAVQQEISLLYESDRLPNYTFRRHNQHHH